MTKEDDRSNSIPIDLVRWSDALQRHIDMPASALWLMACLAHEVDSTVPAEEMTPALRSWLFRVEEMVTQIVGARSWDEAVRRLQIPERSERSLRAWVEIGAAPPALRELLDSQDRITLDEKVFDEFTRILERPAEPTQALRDLMDEAEDVE